MERRILPRDQGAGVASTVPPSREASDAERPRAPPTTGPSVLARIKVQTEHVYGGAEVTVEASYELGGDDVHTKVVARDMATLLNVVLDAMSEARAHREEQEARGRVVEPGSA
jgi:hypothetical protein